MVILQEAVVPKADTLDLLPQPPIKEEMARTHTTLHLKDKVNQAKIHTTSQPLLPNHSTLQGEEDMVRQLMHNSPHTGPQIPTVTASTEGRLRTKTIHLTDLQILNNMDNTKANPGSIHHHQINTVNTSSLVSIPNLQVNNPDTAKEDHQANTHHLLKAIHQEDSSTAKADNIPHHLKTMAKE